MAKNNILKTFASIFLHGTVITLSLTICVVLTVGGCGHNITHTDRGKGMALRIPLPDGSSLVDLKLGLIDSTTTVLRGNATYDASNTTGGSLFGSASTTDRVFVSTGAQMNEGYMKDVLLSPDVDPGTKQLLAAGLATNGPQESLPITMTTVSGTLTTGDAAVNAEVEPVAVGLDNTVNKISKTITEVTPPIADATVKVVDSVGEDTTTIVTEVSEDATTVATTTVDDMSTTISNISKDWSRGVIIVAGIVLLIVIAAIVIIYFIYKRRAKNKLLSEI